MHVRVRCLEKPETVIAIPSKLTKIEDIRRSIQEKFNISSKCQRLFYGGKLLQDGFTFYDYGVKLNDVIQLVTVSATHESVKTDSTKTPEPPKVYKKVEYKDADCKLYELEDRVDAKDPESGAWYQSIISRIVHNPRVNANQSNPDIGILSDTNDNMENESPQLSNGNTKPAEGIAKFFKKPPQANKEKETESNLLYAVRQSDGTDVYCKFNEIRPCARTIIDEKDLKVGMKVMVNYNLDNPREIGLWYDFKIVEIEKLRTRYKLMGTIYLGAEGVPQNDTVVHLHDKVFAIEEVVPLRQRSQEYQQLMKQDPEKRSKPFNCLKCRDNDRAPCKYCGCFLCAGKEDPDKIILCDECNNGFHLSCLSPPLTEVPEDDWYCSACKRVPHDVVAPGAAKQTRKVSTTSKDWGRGMACVGKTKTCAMPEDHFGPIPGIEVGMRWRYRIQLSETGIHRPPVSGIHGREKVGAFSLVLSGGYEDDEDNGHEFTYTGSGGRDLSGNKRTAGQSCDQSLTRENKALARNCAVKQITEAGGDAGDDWKEGKPVRVVRSYKMLKHFPKYSPKEGLRYDGIYKVVKFYPEKGQSGFIVWKYLMRRDDPSPAPWESGAKQYDMILPEGYLEAEAERQALKKTRRKSSTGRKSKDALNDTASKDNETTAASESKNTCKIFSRQSNKQETTTEKVLDNDGKEDSQDKSTEVKLVEKNSTHSLSESDSDSSTSSSKPAKRRSRKLLSVTYTILPLIDENDVEATAEVKADKIHRKHALVSDDVTAPDLSSDKNTSAGCSPQSGTSSGCPEPPPKKVKEALTTAEQDDAIKADTLNAKLWAQCLDEYSKRGKKEFVDGVAEVFLCIICQDVAAWPVTTPCHHNFCMACLKRAYKATGRSCPACRSSLAGHHTALNGPLQAALRLILPGYDAGRK